MQPNVESENSTQWETTDLLMGETLPRYPWEVCMQHGGSESTPGNYLWVLMEIMREIPVLFQY